MWRQLFYSGPFFISAFFIFLVALFTWRRHAIRGARYLIALCLAGAFWAAAEGMLYLGLGLEANILITYLQYLGIAPLPPLNLLFVLTVFDYQSWVDRKTKGFLFSMMVIIIGLVWTNPIHRQVFGGFYEIQGGPAPMLGLSHGVLWWVIIVYHYTLTAILSVVLAHKAVTSKSVYRSQACVMLTAVCVVWGVNGVYVAGYSPVANMDLGPLGFILVAAAMAWGFMKHHLLDLLPVAKTEIFNGLTEAILVLDEKGRLMDLNPAAESLLGLSAADIVGRGSGSGSKHLPRLVKLARQIRVHSICLPVNGEERGFDLRVSALKDRKGREKGRILILQDVTERNRGDKAMLESERLQGVLETAGAVCHELSQPLMAIQGYAELILMELSANDLLRTKINKLVEQTDRLGDMTRKLMHITRYETMTYLNSRIIDLEKASCSDEEKNRKTNRWAPQRTTR